MMNSYHRFKAMRIPTEPRGVLAEEVAGYCIKPFCNPSRRGHGVKGTFFVAKL